MKTIRYTAVMASIADRWRSRNVRLNYDFSLDFSLAPEKAFSFVILLHEHCMITVNSPFSPNFLNSALMQRKTWQMPSTFRPAYLLEINLSKIYTR